MRLIGGDKLINDIKSSLSYKDYEWSMYADEFIDIISDAPTIDAVSVVRCKDCKHNPKYTDDYMYGRCVFCCEDDFYSGTPDDDFYCGYGERKGE